MKKLNDIVLGSQAMTSLAHKDIDVSTNADKIKKIKAFVDSNLISQALTNLTQNAINAIYEKKNNIESNSFEGKIHINLSLNNGKCIISVKDNGIGLPTTNKNELTEPYVSNRIDGTGLGLAIVKKIVDDHDGEFTLKNNKEGGGEAILAFPKLNNANEY